MNIRQVGFGFICAIFLLTVLSCKKAEDRSCFKTTGDDTQIEIKLLPFKKIILTEHLEFVLVQDTVEKAIVIGGNNLLNFITFNQVGDVLEIRNENKCNFLRAYHRKVKVELHFKMINALDFKGTETLSNQDSLHFDNLVINIFDGCGSVYLTLEGKKLYTILSSGYGDFTFNGKVNYANIEVTNNGYCDLYELKVRDSLTAISKSQGNMKVGVNSIKLKAEINTRGNILYKGTPSSIHLLRYGNGELVDMN
jgi:hypothetical protein